MAASFLLLLTSVGLFLSAQAQDCSSPVGGDNMGLKGNDILLQSFPDGTKVTFACDVGYVTAGGSASITCTAGDWSSLRMTCKRKQCGAFEDVPNGNVDYSQGNEFGDKLTVTCKPGYNLVGNPNILCGNEGWMGRPPVCEVMYCHPPKTPTIGSFYPVKEEYEYREVIVFSCPDTFTLNGSKSLSCSESGVFSPAVPECVQIDCKEPVVEFGHWDSGSRGPYTYKATVTFKCDKGYRMTNSATIICGINELWEPALPKCEAVPADTTTTTKSPESTTKPTAVPADKTTTTKSPESTTKPTAPDPNGGKRLYTGLGVAFAAIALVAIAGGLWRCGFLKRLMKKTGSGRGDACAVPTEEDEVALGKLDGAAGP
ncbi:membrane cofactor protein-like isoform X2 [Gymnodraco acuticeps]|uniref:Membrane cofactor protein-like isoform X2 n=1 Tax=Gymnodraco acuticeps TaxID=8218 RepID=A0A6P8W7N8_GYMAC|nr:membrane cofactor protein-like isoform X2 [Gymnodraco acuticeps]